MTAARLSTSLMGASGVTFGLAFLMQSLVTFRDEVDLTPDFRFPFVDVFQEPDTVAPVQNEWIVEEPPVVTLPPETDVVDPDTRTDTPTIDWRIPRAPANPEDAGPSVGRLADGDALPIVRVQPVYPRRALAAGVEGHVTVSLTVNPDGSVDPASIQIVDAEPQGYFEDSARKAAAKFKYKPKVVNGVAEPYSGIRYRFTFSLDD